MKVRLPEHRLWTVLAPSALLALCAHAASAQTAPRPSARPRLPYVARQLTSALVAAVATNAAPIGSPSEVWQRRGNRGTDPATDFLGTTDDAALVFRTNNVERLRILSTGEVVIVSDLTVGRDLRVGRDGTFGRDVGIGNNLRVTFDATVGHDSSIGNDLRVARDATIGRNTAIGGTLDVAGVGRLNNTAQSTAVTNGSLVVAGGAGIAKNLNVGGTTNLSTLNVTSTTDSTSTSNGALVVAGGTGIGKRLNVGGDGLFSSKLGVGQVFSNVRLNVSTDSSTFPFAVTSGTTPKFGVLANGRTTIDSDVTGDSNNTGHYGLSVKSKDQGISVLLDQNKPDSDHKFISFWDQNGIVGRIEGQTLSEYFADPETIAGLTFDAAIVVALGIASADAVFEPADIVSDAAQVALDAALAGIHSANVGVSYASGNGDYAEYLQRLQEGEKISAGEIVGVFGGKISRRTTGAQQLMVVSSAPIVLGNMPKAGEERLYEKVAFLGQVPAKVVGPVNEGDYIVPSGLGDGSGIAIAPEMMTADEFSRVVGRAWGSASGAGMNRVKIAVGMGAGDLAGVVKRHQAEIAALRGELARRDREARQSQDDLQALRSEVAGLRRSVERVAGASPRIRTAALPKSRSLASR